MHAARFLRCLLFVVIFAYACFSAGMKAAEEPTPKDFPTKVADLFKGDWTELHIASALVTDTAKVLMTGVVLSRAAPGKAITCRSAHEESGTARPVNDQTLKNLEIHLFKAATAVHESVTDMEHLQRLTPEQRHKALQDGFQVRGYDSQCLMVWAVTPLGNIILADADEGGSACHALEKFLEHDFGAKNFRVESSDVNEKLGHDPFKGL
jgi:hypothetical protein